LEKQELQVSNLQKANIKYGFKRLRIKRQSLRDKRVIESAPKQQPKTIKRVRIERQSLRDESVIESAPKQQPKKLFHLFNKLIGGWNLHINEDDPLPPISTGYLKVTLICKPEEGFMNEVGTVINIELLKCKEIFRSCLNNGDTFIALKEINEDDSILDDIPVDETPLLTFQQNEKYPIWAIFKRAPPPLLKQGFARTANAETVTSKPLPHHTAYLLKLFNLPEKLGAEQMHERMKAYFPHPEDLLTVDQIATQMKKFMHKKDKEGQLAANDIENDDHEEQ
jgi:hypothetical protein